MFIIPHLGLISLFVLGFVSISSVTNLESLHSNPLSFSFEFIITLPQTMLDSVKFSGLKDFLQYN
jgi:hypothetical protein